MSTVSTANIPAGSPLARKVYGAAVFAQATQANTFSNRLTGKAPKMAKATSKLRRSQTQKDLPFVRVTDLSRERGDTVTVDMFGIMNGKPTMGDAEIKDNLMDMESSTMEIRIDQMRGGTRTPGRMSQQRTVHNMRQVVRAGLGGWWSRTLDQIKVIHAAGARGDHNNIEWNVPLDTDPDFGKIVVNEVKAPTFNRKFYGGDATSVANLDTTDIITLDTLDMLRAYLDETVHPLNPVVLPGDPAAADDPLYCLFVTSRQYHYILNNSNPVGIRDFHAKARERKASNPLFAGEVGLWNGILVKKYNRPIRFNQGSTVKVALDQAGFATQDEVVPTFSATNPEWHAVDRAMLFGAQAVAEAWGRDSMTQIPMRWWEEVVNHGNNLEVSISAMGGCAKLRFEDSDGVETDHGVIAIDSYAPNPRYVSV